MKILAQRPTRISAVTTVLLITMTFIVRERERDRDRETDRDTDRQRQRDLGLLFIIHTDTIITENRNDALEYLISG